MHPRNHRPIPLIRQVYYYQYIVLALLELESFE
jgi:hypothetical protein